MATSIPILPEIDYPESDGTPMAESDPTRDALIYALEALKFHFRNQERVYVSVNLLIYFHDPNTEEYLLTYSEAKQAQQQAEEAQKNTIPKLLSLGLTVEQVRQNINP